MKQYISEIKPVSEKAKYLKNNKFTTLEKEMKQDNVIIYLLDKKEIYCKDKGHLELIEPILVVKSYNRINNCENIKDV